jgi:ABC-2 type transport system ATP-binding protein
VVPQGTHLYQYLTVHQHLRIFAKFRGFPPREAARRADQLVVDLELTAHRDVSVEKLSGGLMRRVLVGIAAMAQPPVMVLDEPTTGLDPQSRRNLWTLLRGYRERGAFVLLTTHSMEEAEILCDRVGILQDSRLLDIDTVDNLRANHGLQSKITYFPDRSVAEGVTLYGGDERELVNKVQELGFEEFSVGRTSLEDIYLAMTGGVEGFDNGF